MFNTVQDANGASYLTPTMATAAAVERYDQLLRRAATEIVGLDNPLSALICSLVIFDTSYSVQDIPQMVAASLKADASDSSISIHWARNHRIFCRELSVHTHDLLQKITYPKDADIDSAITEATVILGSWYPLPSRARRELTLNWIVNDAAAWHYFNLPRPLFADLCGKQPVTPLPADVIARRLLQPRNQSEVSPSQCRESRTEDVLLEAISTSLFGVNESSSSAWLITSLLEALKSKNSEETGPRKATGRAREAAIRSVSKLAGRLESADPTTALVFDFTLFMLNAGTARTAKGNVDTIRGYLEVLAKDLHVAITKIRRHPLDLTDMEWHNQLTNLRGEICTPTRSKSIAALAKYLRSQLGIEVYLHAHGMIERRAVHANVVWRNELSAAVDYLKMNEADQRLQEQLSAILWIGNRAPMRIGEVSLLQMRSVRVIELQGAKHIELEFAPRRGLHAGKSTAARRVMPLGPAEECRVLLDWVEKRKTECANPEEFLFGDPHQPEKLYRLGRSILALNRALKWATGDATVSFHTLRHGVITRLVNQALEIADANLAAARLEEISLFAGHESVVTTLTCYFHAAHTALRRAIDRRLAARFPILNSSPDQSKDSALSELAPQQIDKAEKTLSPSSVTPETSLATHNPSMDGIQKILLDICNQLPPKAIVSRCGISMATLTEYVSPMLEFTARLSGGSTTSHWDSELEPLDVKVKLIKQRLDKLGFDFRQPALQVHKTIWSALKKLNTASMGEVGRSWLRSFDGGVISLENSSDCHSLIKFMRQAAVPAQHFLVRVASDPASYAQRSGTFLQIHFDPETMIGPVEKRSGRPNQYLLVCRRPVLPGLPVPPAVCRMSEVHSAFLVCAVSAFLQRKQG